jgi:hypothetical protein
LGAEFFVARFGTVGIEGVPPEPGLNAYQVGGIFQGLYDQAPFGFE